MKVVIPSAGIGSRIGTYTKYMNKGLVTLGKKPAICHVIEKFKRDTEIVILVGYLGSQLKEVVTAFYPDRKLTFVEVDKYEGNGSGLGYSLMQARKHLQCPFVFIPNDTILPDEIIDRDPDTFGNWVGYYKKHPGDGYNVHSYRTLILNHNDRLATINPKGVECENIYIGLAGIQDYQQFWEAMQENDNAIEAGEVIGIAKLNEVSAFEFKNWFDCGSIGALEKAKLIFKNTDANILEKEDEAIWFAGGAVIKFSANKDFIRDRIKRLSYLPTEHFPKIEAYGEYFYKYKFVAGSVVSEKMTAERALKLFDVCNRSLWSHKTSTTKNKIEVAREFYKTKTQSRLEHYAKRFEQVEKPLKINGEMTPTVHDMLSRFNWGKYLSEKKFSRFHGDLHGENIIGLDDSYSFIDWRQNFGDKQFEYGDTYYDLGKLLHGFIVNHGIVDKGLFWIEQNDDECRFDFNRLNSLTVVERVFYQWCKEAGFDVSHIKVTTALIFLNICGLHDWPYAKFLYMLGRTMLFENMYDYQER